ncbi:MAG: endonuclease/exonuclease/phosphatase family protein [Verrucomicrobiota bacterium]
MNSRRRFLAALPVAAAAAPAIAADRPAASGDGPELRLMTYNLRYASPQGPEAWPLRRPAMKALLEEQAPDLMGTQEGVYGQLRDLASDLPAHDWIGTGRDGGSRGEFMAVFYRRDRFEPLAYDHFWLSDTPEVIGSSTWGNPNRRMVTSVQFRDRRTGLEFHLWNTHLDHALQPAREKGAALIRTRLARLPSSDRVILMGDFNAVATRNVVYEALTREIGFTDSWFSAARRRNESLNSFNGFGKSTFNSARIDWILYRGAAEVSLAEVVDLTPGGRQPSDHFPVVARLRWT